MREWLSTQASVPKVSSQLAKVEVMRACRRVGVDAIAEARDLLAGLHLIPMSAEVVSDATEMGDPTLRTVDALHLASALSIRDDISAFIAYDRRLIAAASSVSLDAQSPGMTAR